MDAPEHERWWTARGQPELCELLLREWDPIGISWLAEAPGDEYEHYAGLIVRRLRAGATEEEIAAQLEGFRTDMGIEPSGELPLAVASLILGWYARSTGEWEAGQPPPSES
jgi:hypothetical protein